MKRKYAICVSNLFILIGLLTGFFILSDIFSERKEAGKNQVEAGVFEWNDEIVKDVDSALEVIEKLNLTRWYQEISDSREEITDEDLASFIRTLHEKKVSVYILIGSVDWGFEEDGQSLKKHLSEILRYNKSAGEKEKIDGVMLDIEPYITKEWKREPETYMDIYVHCMKNAYEAAKEYGVSVAVCIPRHYDDQGLTEKLTELIADACDEAAVMNYGCGDEIEQIRTEEELAHRYGKELHCILEFQEVGKHGLTEEETYRNKGLEAASKVWEEMQKEYPETKIIWDYHSGDAIRDMIVNR